MKLYLTPNEQKFIALAVVSMMDDIATSAKTEYINWNPEARKMMKDIVDTGKSLSIKLKNLGFNMEQLPPLKHGDETEFLTKES